jgi:hypoxanthine phosphoribosyltransferase
MEKKTVNYDYVSFIVDLLEQRVRKDYDFIVGVGRGGINTYDDMTQTGKYVIYQPITIPTKASKILVVDDICDTGNTFNIIRDIYSKEKHLSFEFASLFVKDSKSHLVDYYGLSVSDGLWLDFPWE